MGNAAAFKKCLTFIWVICFMLPAALCHLKTAYAAESEDYLPENGIPVVWLEIDESQGTIAAMNADVNHNTKCYGTIRIDVPEGFRYADFPDQVCEGLDAMDMEIRGRGNSTWEADKKPYKIKLDKKTDVLGLGLGKNKHWVLIANTYDNTFIRDRITAWLGEETGFEFTPRGVPVDLVMTGDQFGTRYLGSYYLSENVRVDDNRLEIDELEEADTSEPEITGGYLLQNSLQTRFGSPDIFTTANGAGWATHTPTFDVEADDDAYDNPAQQQYIQNFIQRIDDALYADDYKDSEGSDYRDLMDIESAAKYWLVNQITMNADAYQTGSTYIYKVRDGNGQIGKLYWGPLWDYDNAWNYMPMTTGFTADFVWEKALLYDRREDGFVEEVKKQWPAFLEALDAMRADGGLIDQYYEETKKSAEADREVNPFRGLEEGEEAPSYEACIQSLKDWIMYRSIWMDYHMDDLDHFMHKVRFVADDEVYKIVYVQDEGYLPGMEAYPEKEGFVFLGWYDENDQKLDPYGGDDTTVKEDITFTAKYISNEEATRGEDIILQKQNDIIDYWTNADYYNIVYTVIPKTAQDRKVTWTSSDESIASINDEGIVTYHQRGTVTFTATISSGVSKEFTLIIADDPLPIPDAIRPEKEVIYLTPGRQSGITLLTDPDPAHLSSFYEYSTDDFDVAVVDMNGVITARGVGETKIHVITEAYDENWEIFNYEAEVTVIVTEDQVEPETPDETETSVETEETAEAEETAQTEEPVQTEETAEAEEPAETEKPAETEEAVQTEETAGTEEFTETEAQKKPVYTVVSGDQMTWKKGSGEDLKVTVRRSIDDETCFDHFTEVLAGGRTLARDKDYTAVRGSTVVTIKADALERMAAGTYSLTVGFDDGKAAVSLTILGEKEKHDTITPDTGDEAHPVLWLIFLAACAAVMGLTRSLKSKS